MGACTVTALQAKLATLSLLASVCIAMEQLDLRFEWRQLEFVRGEGGEGGALDPGIALPAGVERHRDRLFLTVPRWHHGLPASLAYVNLNDNSTRSPLLLPYPNWAAHDLSSSVPEIVSPFRVRADRCDRLWVLDSGRIGDLDGKPERHPPRLLIYNLLTDTLLRAFELPKDQVKEDSAFANIAVEDMQCEDAYAYAGDLGTPGLVVYSWRKNESWRISHHYFHPDPLACDFSVKGHNFSWTDGLFGMSLSAPRTDGYSTLYFHPMASYDEFSVSTEYLRNQSIADANFNAFQLLGSRGPNAQSSASFLDPSTGVLFYSLVNLNAVACWRTTNKEYLMKNQGRIYMDNEKMIYPSDIKVDSESRLWVLSNRLPMWMYGQLSASETNFRVFSAPVLAAISHTACDVTPRSDILDKFVHKIKGAPSNPTSAASPMAHSPLGLLLVLMLGLRW